MSVHSHYLRWTIGLAPAETQTTAEERECLVAHARGRDVLAEIGVWHGVTTCRLRAAMAPAGLLYAVDPYPPGRLGFSLQRRIARTEVARIDNGRVEWVRTDGVTAAGLLRSSLAGRLQFVFIDGDHSYDGVRADWEAWSPLLAPGGIVALHDSRSTPSRPIDDAGSVRYTTGVIRRDPRFSVSDEVESLTVLRRGDGP